MSCSHNIVRTLDVLDHLAAVAQVGGHIVVVFTDSHSLEKYVTLIQQVKLRWYRCRYWNWQCDSADTEANSKRMVAV